MSKPLLTIDMKPLQGALNKLSKDVSGEQLGKAVLAGLFQLEGMAKINVKQNFKQHTGFLAANFETKLDEVTEKSAKGHTSPLAVYARIQELGGVIKATNAPALVFQTEDGNWHRVKAVTIPPRPYLRPAADEGKEDIVAAVSNELKQLIEGK
jgi:phage gpG-like protein